MSTNRIKLPPTIITKLRAEELLGEVAALTLEERAAKTAMDHELTAVRAKYEGALDTLQKQIGDKTALLESWAAANPGEFPKNRKSIDLLHGTVGYRTGTPKLKALPKWTWDRVLEKLNQLAALAYIRTKEEVNKEAVLAAISDGSLLPEQARLFGVVMVQDESFFVEPKLEVMEARKVVAA